MSILQSDASSELSIAFIESDTCMAHAAAAAKVSDPTTLVAYIRAEGREHATAASAGFKRMSDLAPDPSPESQACISKFVSEGGVSAVVAAMKLYSENLEGVEPVQKLDLCEVQEQGCVLLMNLAGAAMAGDASCAKALSKEGAIHAVVRGINAFPESLAADMGEAGVASLMQLTLLDLPVALEAGAVAVVVRSLSAPQAGGWLLFLCARTLSWITSTGGAAAQKTLRDAGAIPALMQGLRRVQLCDPECGTPFGMTDALDQTQVVARHTLAQLIGSPSADGGGLSDGVLKVATFLLDDCAVLVDLKSKPELNGCGVSATWHHECPQESNPRLPGPLRRTTLLLHTASLALRAPRYAPEDEGCSPLTSAFRMPPVMPPLAGHDRRGEQGRLRAGGGERAVRLPNLLAT